MNDEYRALLGRLDRWSAEVVARNPGVIPCRSGCTACCHGPFDITPADAELLREGLRKLGALDRADVRKRGAELLSRMRALAPHWQSPWDVNALTEEEFDGICHALAAEPCPMLGPEGACLVYADRPLVCRLIGIPLVDSDGDPDVGQDVIENECPIQEQFPAYAALAPQPFSYEVFESEEAEILEQTPGGPTVIAAVAAELGA